jgi:hypothetical protein
MGFWLEIGFIYHLRIVTTSNYNTIANLHTLQITTAHAKPSQFSFTSRFLVTDLNKWDSSASVFKSLLSGEYPTIELLLQLTNSQAGGHLTPTSYEYFSLQTDLQLTNLKTCLGYNISARTV